MKTSGITPSREQLNTLLEYFENGRFDKAEKLALSLSKQFPLDNISLKRLIQILSLACINFGVRNYKQNVISTIIHETN